VHPHSRYGCGLPAHRRATAADSSRRDERILIIGAGIAGLAAAAELHALGFEDVAILEARDRIGGRLWTDAIGPNIPVDLGASWIHGTDGNPITAIARGHSIATHPTDYDNDVVHFHHAERPSPSAGRALRRFWQLAERQPDTNLQSVYEQLLEIEPLTAPDRRYLDYLLNTIVEHEQAADLRNLSLESIQGGGAYGGHDAVFPGGYGQVADVLADGLDIRFLEAVTEVDYAGTDIVVTTAAGATFEATRVVVTVPLGVLKQSLISFLPALPLRKRGAIDGLEMGVLNKTCLLFDDVFWDRDVELIGYVGARRGQWAETLNLYPYTGHPILMMFNAGAYGARIERLSDQEIVAQAVAALGSMYGVVPPPRDALITRWRSDPWSRGSYSYVPAGSSYQRYAGLGQPVGDKLFFAGEATHAEFPSTVHGAFLSGIRAARQIAALPAPSSAPPSNRSRRVSSPWL
jgi:monoamine oxidase